MHFFTPSLFFAACAAATLISAPAAHADPFNVTYEAPRAQNTTSAFDYVGVETFDERATGANQSFTTSFGTSAASAIQFSGTYSGVQINAADLYGGAGGTGTYATTYSTAGYALALSAVNTATHAAAPVNYFGFWLSALDAGNEVLFYRGNALVFSFSPSQVQALLHGNSAYLGNPNPAFQGQDGGEDYVFLNFYDTAGAFDKVVFSENPVQGGYESDNHTIGYYIAQSGTAVPEPATLGVLAAGLTGLVLLRRPRKA